ncbi:MAG: response regulator [Chitinophagales bacterium]
MNKIFLVDDDEDDQLFFKEAIEIINPSLQCEMASNGKIAIEKLKSITFLPDIIFLDLNMPVMNGIDFLIQIKRENRLSKIPVCIFTTSSILSDKELTKKLGAQFFLTKPNDFHVLRKKLQQILTTEFLTDEYLSIL